MAMHLWSEAITSDIDSSEPSQTSENASAHTSAIMEQGMQRAGSGSECRSARSAAALGLQTTILEEWQRDHRLSSLITASVIALTPTVIEGAASGR